MSSDDITFDFLRQRAALDLSPEQQAEFQRLVKVLRFGSKFQMIFVEIGDAGLREQLIASLSEILQPAHLRCVQIDLSAAGFDDVYGFERQLHIHNDAKADVIHIVNTEYWLNDVRLHGLNLRREALAHTLQCKLVFWMSPSVLDNVALHAADLWSWRSGVYTFQGRIIAATPRFGWASPSAAISGESSFAERATRISILRQQLSTLIDDELRLPLLDELANLLYSMGSGKEALSIWRDEKLPACRRLGNRLGEAWTLFEIAAELINQGLHGEALQLLNNEVLPIAHELKNKQVEAQVLLHTAYILRFSGKPRESLHLCDTVLQLAVELTDKSLQAQAYAGKAETLHFLNEQQQRLDILREKVLPIWQELNFSFGIATTYGQIAGALARLGRNDEALDIYKNHQLPAWTQLHNVEEVAICQAEIANILQSYGKLDDALRLLEDDVLPVMRKLGIPRSVAVTCHRIAFVLAEQGKWEQALQMEREQCLPIYRQLDDHQGLANDSLFTALLEIQLNQIQQATKSLRESRFAFMKLDEPLASEGVQKIDMLQAKFLNTGFET